MYTCTTLHALLFDLLFYYYVLNMTYPKHMHSFFIFFQHFILGLESSKLPTSVLTLIICNLLFCFGHVCFLFIFVM